mgnify:CR=1 FL=1
MEKLLNKKSLVKIEVNFCAQVHPLFQEILLKHVKTPNLLTNHVKISNILTSPIKNLNSVNNFQNEK